MILLLDNYDSFTHNLAHLLAGEGADLRVVRCDAMTVAEILALEPRGLVLSPGPGTPSERGIAVPLLQAIAGRCPVLGVCLGHQALAEAFGGHTIRASAPRHGRTSAVLHDGQGVFASLPSPLVTMRYHSLVVEPETLPLGFKVSATLAEDRETIMGLRCDRLRLHGVQFHPESFLTLHGRTLARNFLQLLTSS